VAVADPSAIDEEKVCPGFYVSLAVALGAELRSFEVKQFIESFSAADV
jgi:hypothetical protein